MNKRMSLTIMLLLPLLALPGCNKQESPEPASPRPVKAMRVGQEQAFGGRWFPGQATAADVANLSFRVSGTLQSLPVKLGDEFKKGQLLARLDPRDFEVALDNAQAQLQKAQAGLELAQSEYERVARVYEKDPGAVSVSMVEVRKAELDTAKSQIASAQAALSNARDNLSYTTMRAPFDGTVVEKFVENFEDVRAQQEILRLSDSRSLKFVVQVPETLMVNAGKVTGAIVVFDAYPDREIKAKISEIGKEASKTTRTYPITLQMDQPGDFKILPGMAGKARGDREEANKLSREAGVVGVEIPVSAMIADGNKTSVWVINEQTKQVTRRDVKMVNLTEQGAMVTGLEAGEWIVTAGVNSLVENQPVRVLQ